MRRLFLFVLVCLLFAAPAALSQENQKTTDALFAALDEKAPGAMMIPGGVSFFEEGPYMTAVARIENLDVTEWAGLVYDTQAGAFVAWDDLFTDGDAAAAKLEAIAEASSYANAYAEHNRISPMPRDNFAVFDGQLTVYYPSQQLSHVSGQAGAFSFYAYELDGLLKEGVPLFKGDPAKAREVLSHALSEGALPGSLSAVKLGGAMREAAETLGLVDVPDLTYDFAVYRFEDPKMRGVSLLSGTDEEHAETAVIRGIYAKRMDFSGLITGFTTRQACVQALGEPDAAMAVETADAYSRLPVGETLLYRGEGRAMEFHFTDGVLHSVTLRAE